MVEKVIRFPETVYTDAVLFPEFTTTRSFPSGEKATPTGLVPTVNEDAAEIEVPETVYTEAEELFLLVITSNVPSGENATSTGLKPVVKKYSVGLIVEVLSTLGINRSHKHIKTFWAILYSIVKTPWAALKNLS